MGHHLINVKWTALRLKFDVNVREPWAPWCQLQTSYDILKFVPPDENPNSESLWYCSPSGNYYSVGAGQCVDTFPGEASAVPVDCYWATLCSLESPCACTAEGCDAKVEPYVSVDIALRGDEGNGSVGTLGFPFPSPELNGRNIRLIRASH
jgi:hypothetical protein